LEFSPCVLNFVHPVNPVQSISCEKGNKFPLNTSEPSPENTASPNTGSDTFDIGRNGSRASHTRFVGFLGFAGLLTAVFIKPLFSLAAGAIHSQLDSYIVLVPFVSAYLIYDRRKRLPKDYGFSLWAIIPLVAGIIALTTALKLHRSGNSLSDHDYLALMALSFVGFLAAGGFFFLGRKWMTAAAFPFAFLIFIVPMPDAMADTLERASALASAEAASLFFNLTGTPTLREGPVFQLPNIVIQVAQECSGIRSSWVLFITSLLAANLFLKSGWRRAVLVCFVIPLGIARNGLRVAVIGNLCVQFGPQMIHSIIHRRGGPLFFTLSLIPLFLLLWWLHRGEGRKGTPESEVSTSL
jgi:exosortase C (VPDSG-CTERM-specific)